MRKFLACVSCFLLLGCGTAKEPVNSAETTQNPSGQETTVSNEPAYDEPEEFNTTGSIE